MRDDLRDKVVFVTGASSGIGEHIAREAVRRGAKVALVARRKAALEALAASLGSSHSLALVADVAKDGEVEAAARRTVERFGAIDVCVANAGLGATGWFEQMSIEDFRRQLEVNVLGVVRTIYATLEPLKRARGRIGVLGSLAGFLPLPAGSAYSMSKAAIRILCGALKHELRPHGVSVLHVAPGFVRSETRLKDNRGVLREGARDPVPDWLQMPTAAAARRIVRALERRQSELVLPGHAKLVHALAHYFPSLFDLVMGAVVTRTARRLGL